MQPRTLSPTAAAAIALVDGLTPQHLGGGCFALHLELSDCSYLLITSSEEENDVPVRLDEPVLVGWYSTENDDMAHYDFPTLAEALRDLWGRSEGEQYPEALRGDA